MATVFITPPQQSQSSSMAVNLFPDTPRISFSYNLDHLPSPDHNLVVARSDQNLSSDDPNFDFDFRLPDCRSGQEASPADELFLNGVLLPAHIKPTTPIPTPPSICKKHDLAEEEEQGGVIIVTSTKASLIREEKGQPKSFWRFMRSTSLNYDSSSHSKKGSIWSSLPLLARSNSTGHGKLHRSSSSSSSNHRQPSKLPSSGSTTRFHHKPPLRKAQFSGSGNSSPVLNVPSPYITKGTSDLLGLGSFFRGGSAKKGKKP